MPIAPLAMNDSNPPRPGQNAQNDNSDLPCVIRWQGPTKEGRGSRSPQPTTTSAEVSDRHGRHCDDPGKEPSCLAACRLVITSAWVVAGRDRPKSRSAGL
ncbi:hypothetical protein GCM10010176_092170 [Nonomuraea spiralis]|nr:hypothetical protein GCM10010176_092170 [Nonomuraea spiralis]